MKAPLRRVGPKKSGILLSKENCIWLAKKGSPLVGAWPKAPLSESIRAGGSSDFQSFIFDDLAPVRPESRYPMEICE